MFHTIRRQSKVVISHTGHSQVVTTAATSRDQNHGQVQQRATGATSTTGANLSHTELNVLKTMIAVIACFVIFWSVTAISNFLQLLGVSTQCSKRPFYFLAQQRFDS